MFVRERECVFVRECVCVCVCAGQSGRGCQKLSRDHHSQTINTLRCVCVSAVVSE